MRARIQMLVTVEYDLVPENYPKNARKSPEAMLKIDITGAKGDAAMFLDMPNAKCKFRGHLLYGTEGTKSKKL